MRNVRISKNPESEDLDLAPMLAMIVSLIPILLMAFSFYHTAVVEAKVPVPSTQAKKKNADEDIRVLLEINGNRQVQVLVKRRNQVLLNEKVNSQEGHINLGELTAAVKRVHQKFPQISKVEMNPSGEISYLEVIEAIDGIKTSGENEELFRDVVFSNIFKG